MPKGPTKRAMDRFMDGITNMDGMTAELAQAFPAPREYQTALWEIWAATGWYPEGTADTATEH